MNLYRFVYFRLTLSEKVDKKRPKPILRDSLFAVSHMGNNTPSPTNIPNIPTNQKNKPQKKPHPNHPPPPQSHQHSA